MKSKRRYLLVFLAALLVIVACAGCGKAKVGYIDGTRVTKESPQLTAIMTEGNDKLMQLQQENKDLLLKGRDSLSPDEQKKLQQVQANMSGIQQQYTMQLKQKVDTAMAEITKEKGLDAVVDNEEAQKMVLEGGIDITDELIQKLQ